jgi:hypothetical protein
VASEILLTFLVFENPILNPRGVLLRDIICMTTGWSQNYRWN